MQSWQVLEDNWSSDHFPIIIEYKNTCFQTSYKYTPRWSYKQANWEKIQDSCNELISEPDQTTNIDEICDMFMVQLNNACNTAIPKTKPHKKNKIPTPWWNEACHQAIQQKKEALKRLRKSFLPEDLINYKRSCAIVKRTIKNAQRTEWKCFCNDINSNTPISKIWQKIKKINKTQVSFNIPTIAHEGQNAITNEEKANALAYNFAKVSSDIKYDDDFKEIKMHEENKFTFHDPNNDSVLNEPFNIAELNTAIDKSKCTTPGKD